MQHHCPDGLLVVGQRSSGLPGHQIPEPDGGVVASWENGVKQSLAWEGLDTSRSQTQPRGVVALPVMIWGSAA